MQATLLYHLFDVSVLLGFSVGVLALLGGEGVSDPRDDSFSEDLWTFKKLSSILILGSSHSSINWSNYSVRLGWF